MSDRQDNPTAAFDDDRMLDYVLGLEDDPELAAALATSAPLRERLADLKADLAAIETELRETIPPVDAAYAEPASGRWPRLQRFFGGERARRPRSRRRLAASLAAAILLVAALIGFVSVLPRMRSGSSSSTTGSTGGFRAPALSGSGATGEKSADQSTAAGVTPAPSPAGANGAATGGSTDAAAVAAFVQGYRDVAVVRAGSATGLRQSFTVRRVLKGSPPHALVLKAGPSGKTAVTGSLQLVFLRPAVSSSTVGASSPAASAGGSAGAGVGVSFGPPVAFWWHGESALLVALHGVTDPAAVTLP